MSERTQRMDEIRAMCEAVVASSSPTETVSEMAKRVTGLNDEEAAELVGTIVGGTLAGHGIYMLMSVGPGDPHAVLQAVFLQGLDLGVRLGLEEAARMPTLGPAPPPPPPSKPSRSPRRWWIR